LRELQRRSVTSVPQADTPNAWSAVCAPLQARGQRFESRFGPGALTRTPPRSAAVARAAGAAGTRKPCVDEHRLAGTALGGLDDPRQVELADPVAHHRVERTRFGDAPRDEGGELSDLLPEKCTSRPHFVQLREKSSSSRSSSAFTLSSSGRSILACVTSGSDQPWPTSIASSTRASASLPAQRRHGRRARGCRAPGGPSPDASRWVCRARGSREGQLAGGARVRTSTIGSAATRTTHPSWSSGDDHSGQKPCNEYSGDDCDHSHQRGDPGRFYRVKARPGSVPAEGIHGDQQTCGSADDPRHHVGDEGSDAPAWPGPSLHTGMVLAAPFC
jgi:hypothetical protein